MNAKRSNPYLALASVLTAIACLLCLGGCALFESPHKPALMKTKTLVIYFDRKFNQGMKLPLDIAFANLKNPIAQITAIKPDDWFTKQKRDRWPFKQSFSFSPGAGGHRSVKLKPPADCDGMVIFANYINLSGSRGQAVTFGAESAEQEVVFVTDKGLFR